MGWDLTKDATKADIVRELTKTRPGFHTLFHQVVGNTLWAIVRTTDNAEIVCYLLTHQKGYGWGYKSGMPESVHPYQYDCPLEFLDLAGETCAKWREAVRKYHRTLTIGQTFTLQGVDDPTISPVTLVEITSRKIVGRDKHGRRWRINRAQLDEEVKS